MKTTLAMMLLTLCAPGMLAAQPATPIVPSAPSLPKWNALAAFSLQDFDASGKDEQGDGTVAWYGDGLASLRMSLGRYWTQHLKTELSLNPVATELSGFETSTTEVGGASPIFTYTQRDGRLSRLTLDGVYQFGENVFTHPYVAAGLSVDRAPCRGRRQVLFQSLPVCPS